MTVQDILLSKKPLLVVREAIRKNCNLINTIRKLELIYGSKTKWADQCKRLLTMSFVLWEPYLTNFDDAS